MTLRFKIFLRRMQQRNVWDQKSNKEISKVCINFRIEAFSWKLRRKFEFPSKRINKHNFALLLEATIIQSLIVACVIVYSFLVSHTLICRLSLFLFILRTVRNVKICTAINKKKRCRCIEEIYKNIVWNSNY